MSLARSLRAGASSSESVAAAIEKAAEWLHNTPAVARDSYVNPRLAALFEKGRVADPKRLPDRAVLAVLLEDGGKGKHSSSLPSGPAIHDCGPGQNAGAAILQRLGKTNISWRFCSVR